MTTLRVGTSGWSYPEWVGSFYPEKTSSARMLQFYAERFLTVEAHSTHRRLPTATALARWVRAVSEDFRFSPKAHVGITHRRDLEGVRERIAAFGQALQPLGQRLGPVLFVLPHRQPDLARLNLLLAGLAGVASIQPVFELAPGWWVDDVFARLDAHGASLALVERDDPPAQQRSPPPIGPVGYFRLRRSAYTDDELRRWADRLSAHAPSRPGGVYVFFKHDQRGDAPRYARDLVEHLERR